MKLLYLPIDIDLSGLSFTRSDNLEKVPVQLYQPKWWDAAILNSESIEKNNLLPIVNQLPYDKITLITHKFQNEPVGPHFDVYPGMRIPVDEQENIKENEPCGYRIVLKGSTNVLKIHNGKEWLIPKVPASPCCYLINSTALKHQVLDDPGREILYLRGIINKEKNQQLIERSLKTYGDYAVYQET